MARPRAFKDDEVFDAAVACFWRRGLDGTSVRDLATQMGISGPSLYNAFGDKRTLFVQSLERYAACYMRERIERLERQESPKFAIQLFFQEVVSRSITDTDHRGCLIINSALEVAPHDRALRKVVVGYLGEIECFFARCLERAKAAREVPRGIEIADTARLFLGLLIGLRVAARANPDRLLLEGMVRPALALLDHPKSPRKVSQPKGASQC